MFYLFQDEEEPPKREVLGEKWRPAALAGYFTVFGFRNPVKGVSLRICQALVLPQFQRQGAARWHGGKRCAGSFCRFLPHLYRMLFRRMKMLCAKNKG